MKPTRFQKTKMDETNILKKLHLNLSNAFETKRNWIFLYSLIAIIFFNSCISYQFVGLQSKVKQDDSQCFVIENDTVKITYSFNGQNCPVQISLLNKLNKPIYVDWKKSSLIVNSRIIPYWIDEAQVNLVSSGYDVKTGKGTSFNISQTDGTIYKSEKITFIPPDTHIKNLPLRVTSSFFKLPPADNSQKRIFGVSEGTVEGTLFTFNETDTPLKFRSYLAISVDEQFSVPIYVDTEFWVNEIIEIKDSAGKEIEMRPDQFNVEEKRGSGALTVSLLLLGIFAYSLVPQ